MSYDSTITTDKDKVRLAIGDTGEGRDFFLSDEEIQYYLSSENDNVLEASIRCAEAIAAQLAPEVSYQASTLRQEAAQAFDHFLRVADRLRERADRNVGLPAFVHSGDEPRDPIFELGMHDNEETITRGGA